MPRMKTPQGYYTISEAAKVLDLSSAMVRRYVEKGKIRYLLPDGRSHGFYSKKDVDNLAHELNAFMSLNDSTEDETSFSIATEDELIQITQIAYALFIPDQEPPSSGTPQWHLNAIKKNPYMDYVLRKNEQLLGYVSIVPFSSGNPKIYRCLEVEALSEIGITPDDIETFDAGHHIDLYIMAMAINPKLSTNDRRKYGYRLIARFVTQMVGLATKGVIIDKIIARGDTRSGVKLLQSFGFTEIISRKKGTRAFQMNINESGAHFAIQYKEALAEWKQEHS